MKKLTGKVHLLYSYMNDYMSNPDQARQIALGNDSNISPMFNTYADNIHGSIFKV